MQELSITTQAAFPLTAVPLALEILSAPQQSVQYIRICDELAEAFHAAPATAPKTTRLIDTPAFQAAKEACMLRKRGFRA